MIAVTNRDLWGAPVFSDIILGFRTFLERKAALKALSQERRERLADYLTKVSECMDKIVDEHHATKNYYVKECGELLRYSEQLHTVASGVLDEDDARRIHERLKSAVEIPMSLFGTSWASDPPELNGERFLVELSGYLSATSHELRAM